MTYCPVCAMGRDPSCAWHGDKALETGRRSDQWRMEMANDEKLRKLYRKEGWGVLAEMAGFDPVNTESAARSAFIFSADLLAEKQNVLMTVTASLAAAISLLEKSSKKGAPSNTMFDQMLSDYRKSLDLARTELRRSTENVAD